MIKTNFSVVQTVMITIVETTLADACMYLTYTYYAFVQDHCVNL